MSATFMSQKEFSETYDIDASTVGAFALNNKNECFILEVDGKRMLDNKYLEYLQTSRRTLWHTAHDSFFQLRELGVNDMQQSLLLEHLTKSSQSSWYVFLKDDLFRLQTDRLTFTRRPNRLYNYVVASNAILKVLHKHNYKAT